MAASPTAPPTSAGTLKLIAPLTPPSSTRTWLTVPHHSLPLVATATSDKTVRVYSLRSFTLHSTVSGGHKRSVRSCAWKPGTKGESVLATGSFDASAGIWRRWDMDMGMARERDLTGGVDEGDEEEDEGWRFSVILDGHESEIKSVAWSASGQFLATCSRDKSVWIWEEMEDDNFETIAVLQEHEADVKCVAWHPEEELLASSSYDDTIRLYREDIDDWTGIAVLSGHDSTVWSIDFEPAKPALSGDSQADASDRARWIEAREASGPRLVSGSDDRTLRIWRRRPKQKQPAPPTGQGRIPSIIRTHSIEEDWYEEARLPVAHERAIYSVAWSKRTGRIVSTGGDGRIVVYEERWSEPKGNEEKTDGLNPEGTEASDLPVARTTWSVVASIEMAHDVFEVNHVTFARRFDSGRTSDDEEIIISTGDDGQVKVWTVEI
ncbi:WD40 repeat-like protein [Xylona heveae TC161]|uniref:Probable cytosolic iron-sulfur protein assembly protein 1 n=1 Tax=Xylona heveae (strain CBS 132557 / TC161) TaxID=1328760 RepID=A0A165J615_XYLHT|nr:WD40 repeat-like protein [Xylona heveae TC161]KZF25781.1 WD40 repeat-like protein [Xylona heveae TC161]